MALKDLGYTEKWIKYGFLTEEILHIQFTEFLKGKDSNSEHYRYSTFLNWLRQKDSLTDLGVNNFVELALDDPDQLMAGSAIKELFTCPKISDHQFDALKRELPKFGEWTTKLIQRELLKRRIKNEDLTSSLVSVCIKHANDFNENVLIELIIDQAEKTEHIQEFTSKDFGKKIRNLANQKIKQLTIKSQRQK